MSDHFKYIGIDQDTSNKLCEVISEMAGCLGKAYSEFCYAVTSLISAMNNDAKFFIDFEKLAKKDRSRRRYLRMMERNKYGRK